MIQSWSHSRLVDFEKCKFMAFLKYEQRIPEPERPLPPGKTEHANDRGTRVHEALERYARGQTQEFPPEARAFKTEMDAMRKLFDAGKASFEGEWGYNRAWEAVPWQGEWMEAPKDAEFVVVKALPQRPDLGVVYKVGKGLWYWLPTWLRMKLDAIVFLTKHEAVAIDYKTGKIFGNEVKHGEQLMLYQLAAFLRYPELEVVHTELWYLDHDELRHKVFTRAQGLRFQKSWDMRGTAITTATEFPPNPNKWSCQYCPYGKPENGFPQGTGHCAAGKK
jgi:hypothetical protein